MVTKNNIVNLRGVSYDRHEGHYYINSSSIPDKRYRLTPFRSTNTWSCECPDFMYKKEKKHECKHIIRLRIIDELAQKRLLEVPLAEDAKP